MSLTMESSYHTQFPVGRQWTTVPVDSSLAPVSPTEFLNPVSESFEFEWNPTVIDDVINKPQSFAGHWLAKNVSGELATVPEYYTSDMCESWQYSLPSSPENYFLTSSMINSPAVVQIGEGLEPVIGVTSPLSVAHPTAKPKSLIESLLTQTPCVESVSVELSNDAAIVPDLFDEDNVMEMLNELGDRLDGDMIFDQVELSKLGAFLQPVSLDDVESVLSSPPPSLSCLVLPSDTSNILSPPIYSPQSTTVVVPTSEIFGKVESPPSLDYAESNVSSPAAPSPLSCSSETLTMKSASYGSSRYEPYGEPRGEKRERKKEQNKSAALRYRLKKKDEQGSTKSEFEALEKRNVELRTRVEEMTREITYLKNLIEEICG